MYLVSYSAAAKELGIDRKMVAGLARRLRIVPKPLSGRGKGLDAADVALIRRALKQLDRLAISA